MSEATYDYRQSNVTIALPGRPPEPTPEEQRVLDLLAKAWEKEIEATMTAVIIFGSKPKPPPTIGWYHGPLWSDNVT